MDSSRPPDLTKASAILICLPLLLTMAWYLRKDAAEYAEFKSLTGTVQRQNFYKLWTVHSFFLYAGLTVIALLIFDRLNDLLTLPAEFQPLATQIRNSLADENEFFDPNLLPVLVTVFIVSSLISPTLIAYLTRKKAQQLIIGDIQPLMPRNRPEKFWAAIISINAGLSEELFFRLLLPLLLVLVLGDVVAAFAVSALSFGLVHFYQGWAGVILTTILGGILTLVYLGTGHLWIAIIVHAAIDLNGLILQPFLASLIRDQQDAGRL